MKLGTEFFLDFEHDADDGWSAVYLYDTETKEEVGRRHSSVHHTDTFSRKMGRRACMEKLLHAETGVFPGYENKNLRTYLWREYWKLQPKDKEVW